MSRIWPNKVRERREKEHISAKGTACSKGQRNMALVWKKRSPVWLLRVRKGMREGVSEMIWAREESKRWSGHTVLKSRTYFRPLWLDKIFAILKLIPAPKPQGFEKEAEVKSLWRVLSGPEERLPWDNKASLPLHGCIDQLTIRGPPAEWWGKISLSIISND